MPSEPRSPIEWLVSTAWKLFSATLLIWLAVELLSQIWMWIIGTILVIGLTVLVWRMYQVHRDIW